MLHIFHNQLPFVVVLLVVLVTAKVFGEISERFGQPSMIGELLAGLVLGPSVFNIIGTSNELKVIADLGVFLLIVLAGMEIEVEEIRNSVRGRNAWIAIMGFIIPFICGFFLGVGFHYNYTFSIFLGLSIAITALPVSVRILMDLGRLKSDVGQRIISAAIFNDVISLLILGIILDFNGETTGLKDLVFSTSISIGKVAIFIIILYFAYKMFKLAKRKVRIVNPKANQFLNYLQGKESLFAIVIVFVLFFASIAEFLGMHFVVGAFFGAILFPRSMITTREFNSVRRTTSGISMGFLAPIFFAYMGIACNIMSINNILLLSLVLVASFFSKIFGGFVGGKIAGFDNLKSVTLGLGMNARGLVELVIASIALQRGFIDIPFFTILVIMALLTTLLTPVFLQGAFNKIDKRTKSH
jgi:Kef-type K+ transport system membrane component KefB